VTAWRRYHARTGIRRSAIQPDAREHGSGGRARDLRLHMTTEGGWCNGSFQMCTSLIVAEERRQSWEGDEHAYKQAASYDEKVRV
jgi:hypothetical protein